VVEDDLISSDIWLPYAQMMTAPEPLVARRTQGSRIYLDDGRCLIDGIASWWTACHGYAHPKILADIEAQLRALPHLMLGGLLHAPVRRLAARLARRLPGGLNHCFFSESGSVAVEVAMKMAIQFWLNQGATGRTRFVSFEHAYHGDTFAAMSVCDPEEGMHRLFRGVLARQHVVPLPVGERELDRFENTIERHACVIAGLIIEPLVQAAGGFAFHTPETLERIVRVARRHGLIVIFDEIATGFGRTGSLFAMEQTSVVPDIVTLAKALTGGTLPMAVTVANDRVFDAFLSEDFAKALMHGPTYAGNAAACAAANASLDLFESEPRLEQVAAIALQLEAELAPCAQLPGVRDVRVKGAIGVVELEQVPDIDRLRSRFLEADVWIRPFDRYVYLMPAFTITPEELGILTNAIYSVLADYLA
jgi:adenosylmethionine-8-amino-7-oxononanoate aminotransferase